jgi:hypothetical protein
MKLYPIKNNLLYNKMSSANSTYPWPILGLYLYFTVFTFVVPVHVTFSVEIQCVLNMFQT